MITMQDIAKKAGVSRATVSRVLSNPDSVKNETKRIVLYWINELGYEPNKTAQALAGNHSGLIGIIVPDTINYYYAKILQHAEYLLSKQGYNLLLCCSQNSYEKELKAIKLLHARKTDGILLFPLGNCEDEKYNNIKIPIVTLGRTLKTRSGVVSNINGGVKKIAQYFLKNNHKKVGYVGPVITTEKNNKFLPFYEYIHEHNMTLTNTISCTSNNANLAETIEKYFHTNDCQSTAWFAHNDEAAVHLINILKRLGYMIPNNVIVAGYDDTNLSTLMSPHLTTVRQPLEEMVQKAIELLINEINNTSSIHKIITLDNILIVRESTLAESSIIID